MEQIVSITSQGQITIPAKMRRALKLDKHKKAVIRQDKEKLIVEPVEDILVFKGALKNKAMKGKAIKQIIEIEEKAWGEAVAEK